MISDLRELPSRARARVAPPMIILIKGQSFRNLRNLGVNRVDHFIEKSNNTIDI